MFTPNHKTAFIGKEKEKSGMTWKRIMVRINKEKDKMELKCHIVIPVEMRERTRRAARSLGKIGIVIVFYRLLFSFSFFIPRFLCW